MFPTTQKVVSRHITCQVGLPRPDGTDFEKDDTGAIKLAWGGFLFRRGIKREGGMCRLYVPGATAREFYAQHLIRYYADTLRKAGWTDVVAGANDHKVQDLIWSRFSTSSFKSGDQVIVSGKDPHLPSMGGPNSVNDSTPPSLDFGFSFVIPSIYVVAEGNACLKTVKPSGDPTSFHPGAVSSGQGQVDAIVRELEQIRAKAAATNATPTQEAQPTTAEDLESLNTRMHDPEEAKPMPNKGSIKKK